MSIAVLCVAPTGGGKSHSIVGLPPKTNYLINPDKKALPIKGFFNSYFTRADADMNNVSSNYIVETSLTKIMAVMDIISKERSDIKTITVDTISHALLAKEMDGKFRARKKGGEALNKWYDLAEEGWDFFNKCSELRKDLIVYVMAHSNLPVDSDTITFRRMITNGRKLEKIVPESIFPIVLHYSKKMTTSGAIEYKMISEDINSTAKAPVGMFSDSIFDNNLGYVDECIREYYGINK